MPRSSTKHPTRRSMLAALAPVTLAAFEIGRPDLILSSGRIWTADTDTPRGSAVAIRDGRFLVVGSNDETRFPDSASNIVR